MTIKQIIGNSNRKPYVVGDMNELLKKAESYVEPEIKVKPEREKKQKTSPIFQPISFNTNIVKSDYIQIPNQNFLTAIAETNFNLNYENAHIKTLKQGLEILPPYKFMIFHNYILDCYKNNKPIYDAQGNAISDSTKSNLYTQLTSNCWTWLNGKFNISDKKKTIEYVTGIDKNDNLLTKTEDLEDYLIEDCYIDFTKLTKQGLASVNSKHSNQTFAKGEDIYYYYPKDGKVAGFDANSVRAILGCCGNPSSTVSSLGVRAGLIV